MRNAASLVQIFQATRTPTYTRSFVCLLASRPSVRCPHSKSSPLFLFLSFKRVYCFNFNGVIDDEGALPEITILFCFVAVYFTEYSYDVDETIEERLFSIAPFCSIRNDRSRSKKQLHKNYTRTPATYCFPVNYFFLLF